MKLSTLPIEILVKFDPLSDEYLIKKINLRAVVFLIQTLYHERKVVIRENNM